ncbi:MAG: hypothetical protein EOO65_00245 [Methanosarcinales archaeon]|nr:MAG: hypothetical protein EOO65_00245 [Methanosarcinales archaeon]
MPLSTVLAVDVGDSDGVCAADADAEGVAENEGVLVGDGVTEGVGGTSWPEQFVTNETLPTDPVIEFKPQHPNARPPLHNPSVYTAWPWVVDPQAML